MRSLLSAANLGFKATAPQKSTNGDTMNPARLSHFRIPEVRTQKEELEFDLAQRDERIEVLKA